MQRETVRFKITILLVLFTSLFSVAASDLWLSSEDMSLSSDVEMQEVLYLPSGEALQVISFGYRSALSHYLWFTTLNYFGKHYETDGEYKWLYHRCDLVTRLNPFARHVYKFCSLMLAWEQNVPEMSLKILNRAVSHFPNDWEFYYHRGFVHFFFLGDEERGREDLIRSAKSPGVHHGVASLATKKVAEGASTEMAMNILQEMLSTTNDPLVRKVIIDRMRKLKK